MRTHARAFPRESAYDFKPFDRGRKVSVIGALTVSRVSRDKRSLAHCRKVSVIGALTVAQVLAVMTLDDSMAAATFQAYVSELLVPQLWAGAVVVMDNLRAHKVAAIAPLIEAVGARILERSPYSPDFNPIEPGWSQ